MRVERESSVRGQTDVNQPKRKSLKRHRAKVKCCGKDAPAFGEADDVVRLPPLPCDASIRSKVFPCHSCESTAFAYRNGHHMVRGSTYGPFASEVSTTPWKNRAISSCD